MRMNRFTLSALALLAGLSVAAAQQQAPANQATNPIGDGSFKSQQGGKEEPGSHASDTATTAVLVAGKLNVPGGAAGQSDRAVEIFQAQCRDRLAADHGNAARSNRRTETSHRRQCRQVRRACGSD